MVNDERVHEIERRFVPRGVPRLLEVGNDAMILHTASPGAS